ncbi:MAG: hypothetical protein JO013_10115 [Alphaproteobacteria bacterium]|nr:hypothetical protein [Alphaproteobacteria bacterium]
MADVAVRRLRVTGPAARRALAAFRIEDGCRTAIPDEERLVLLRRLRLPPDATAAHPRRRERAIGAAWRSATAGARHGSADRAAESDCVWFASREEARRLLLALLLAGRVPQGWFWRLAVPEWGGAPLAPYVRTLMREALRTADAQALPPLALQLVEAGRAQLLVEALAEAGGMGSGPGEAEWRPRQPRPLAQVPADARSDPLPEGFVAARLEALRARLPDVFRAAVETIARRLPNAPLARRRLIEAALLCASPDLRLAPATLATLAEAYAFRLDAPGSRRAALASIASSVTPPPAKPTPAPSRPALAADDRAHSPAQAGPAAGSSSREPVVAEAGSFPIPAPCASAFSAAAGLWLVLPALIRLGWRDWLLARPALIGTDPGRTLLAAIAAHHRVAWSDPALAPLGFDNPPPMPAWAEAWRRALSRHLRRTSRLSLHALVWRSGRIACDEERLVVGFPITAIDLRLRRRALDADPGWVDWLGLSVRYRFGGESDR